MTRVSPTSTAGYMPTPQHFGTPTFGTSTRSQSGVRTKHLVSTNPVIKSGTLMRPRERVVSIPFACRWEIGVVVNYAMTHPILATRAYIVAAVSLRGKSRHLGRPRC